MSYVAPSYWSSPELLMVSIGHGGGRLLDVVSVTLLPNYPTTNNGLNMRTVSRKLYLDDEEETAEHSALNYIGVDSPCHLCPFFNNNSRLGFASIRLRTSLSPKV